MFLRVVAAVTALAGFSAGAEFRSEAEARRSFARLLAIPREPPAVEVRVVSSREEEGLRIEDVQWQSLDGEVVPAYLIRPSGSRRPLAAIVCLHGTGGSRESETAARFGIGPWTRPGDREPHERMLGWARELARRGYLTLSLTQRGLDVRRPDTNDQAKDLLVRGRTLMGAIVYEIRQGITYLRSRRDVRPDAIAVSGMSFGGITSFYAWLVDERIAAAAPICGGVGSVDVFLRKGVRSYHGFYWWIPRMLTAGDQGDFAAALAPRPLMLWAPMEDIGMPAEGVDRFLAVVQPAYDARGRGSLVVHRPAGGHSFTPEAFEALTEFFDARLRTSPRETKREQRDASGRP